MKIEQSIYDELEAHYGSHSNVARKLKITPRHYRLIRNTGGGSELAKVAIMALHQIITQC